MNKKKLENLGVILLGIYTFFSPWLITHKVANPETIQMINWNAWIIGILVVGTAVVSLQKPQIWTEGVNIVLGTWCILSPWVLGYSFDTSYLWSSLIVGFLIILLSSLALPESLKPLQMR